MILAQNILDMFEVAGASPRERRTALEIASTIVLDSFLFPTTNTSELDGQRT